MNSHHAPDYCQLSSIVKKAIEIIDRLLDPTDPLNDQAGIENSVKYASFLSAACGWSRPDRFCTKYMIIR